MRGITIRITEASHRALNRYDASTMIRIILEDNTGKEVKQLFARGNESIFFQADKTTFPLISEIDICSYSTYSHSDMKNLIKELNMIKGLIIHPENQRHIDDICVLASICAENKGWTLSFTPFDE